MLLRNFRVLDLSRIWAGPYCTKLFADMGASPEKVAGTWVSDNALRHAAIATFDKLEEQGISDDASLAMMSAAEPFRSSWKRTEQLLEKHLKGAHSDV